MSDTLRLGIIGLDTSHVTAFTTLLHEEAHPHHVPGARIVAAYPSFSPDMDASRDRVQGFTAELRDRHGVAIVNSIEELLDQVDAVLLESVDGRRHLAEATPVLKAGKPLFIDKPLAANYQDAVAIAALAARHACPLFSASSLRYDVCIQATKADPALGTILACDAYTNARLEPTNPGLFFYGIHGVEILFTFMGPGCQNVHCHHARAYDVIVGTWPDGRLGTLRGIRTGTPSFGATVFGTEGIRHTGYSPDVPFYSQLLREIVPFLRGGPAPVPIEETLEIMAFMQAALQSSTENRPVTLREIQAAA